MELPATYSIKRCAMERVFYKPRK